MYFYCKKQLPIFNFNLRHLVQNSKITPLKPNPFKYEHDALYKLT